MTTRLTAAILAIVFAAPVAAQCSYGATSAEISCAPGTTWDAETSSCVEELTG